MHAPASRRQPSARSRMLSSTDSARAGRGLGDVVTGVVHGVSGVVHDASDVAHDVGHAVGDVLSGQLSRIPDDLLKTTLDVAKTGKDVVGVVPEALYPSAKHTGGQSHSGGGEGGTQPRPPPAPGSGGGEGTAPYPKSPDGSQAPSSTTRLESSTSPSSEYTAPASSTASNTVAGAANAAPDPSHILQPTNPMDLPAMTGSGQEDGQSIPGVQLWSISSANPSLTTMDTLPSNSGSGGGGNAHRKGFPLAAAAALGAVLGFLIVSLLFWAVWLYLRKRRALRAVYLPPKRMLSVTTERTVSTVPLFISASEAGVKDENPFKHPRDVQEDDPFDAASLWRSSTTRSASTLSV